MCVTSLFSQIHVSIVYMEMIMVLFSKTCTLKYFESLNQTLQTKTLTPSFTDKA